MKKVVVTRGAYRLEDLSPSATQAMPTTTAVTRPASAPSGKYSLPSAMKANMP